MDNDLISRSALLEGVLVIFDENYNDCSVVFEDDIENAPAVDAVDVDKAMTWLEGYTMTDTEEIYSNGTVFVPLYRVKQAFVDKLYNGLWEADDGEQSAAESQTQES